MAYNTYHSDYAQGSGTTQLGNEPPGPPTSLETQNLNTVTPQFRATFQDDDAADEGIKYRIEVRNADNGGGSLLWDSGSSGTALSTPVAVGDPCEWITYAGSALVDNTTYYWRIKFWDDSGGATDEGDWSHTTSWPTFSLAVPPVVAITAAAQRTDGSKTFDVTYNLSDAGDSGTDTVTLAWRNSSGGSWTNAVSVSGHVGAGVAHGNGKAIVWVAGTDDAGVEVSTLELRVTAVDAYSNSGNDVETGITIDTKNPTAPGNFTFASRTGTSITLNLGVATTDTNFFKYRMFYKNGTSAPVESDSEHVASFFNYINYQSNTQVTVPGLTAGQYYSFRLYAYDTFGNKVYQAAYLTATTNSPPVASYVSLPAQTTDGTRIVNVSVSVDDFNDDDVKMLVEYSTSGTGPWTKCTITGTPTVSYGSVPDVNNAAAYQIGSSTPFNTSSGANTVGFKWDVGTDSVSLETTYWMQVTVNDSIAGASAITASGFPTDTKSPINTAVTLGTIPPTALGTSQSITIAWTEGYPNINEAGVQINGTGGWSTQTGTPNTTTPPAITVSHSAIYGNQYIKVRGRHVDDYGNETITINGTNYYVKPAKPGTPIIGTVYEDGAAVTPVDNATDATGILPDAFQHAIYVSGPSSGWVQASGVIGGSAVWQTVAAWGTVTITGLASYTLYNVQTKVRNPNSTSIESELSDQAPFTTASSPPAIRNLQVLTPSNGSKIYRLEAELQDEDNSSVTVVWKRWNGSAWVTLSSVTGDTGVVSGVPAPPSWKAITAYWDAGTNVPATEQAGCKIQLNVSDVESTTTAESSTFVLDTKNPSLAGITLFFTNRQPTSVTINWTTAATEGYLSTYALYLSTISIANALAKGGICWNNVDDANLATLSTTSTNVTGLTEATTYFVAMFATDIRGNENTTNVVGSVMTSASFALTGFVHDSNGYFIPGATVAGYLADSGEYINSGTTDARGYYQVPVTEAGPYYVVVSKALYGSYVIDDQIAEPT